MVLSTPDVALPAPTAPVRPPASHAVPAKWPRVSLAKTADDPGLGLVESRAAPAPGAGASAGASDEGDLAAADVLRGPSRLGAALPVRRLNDAAVLGSPVTWALIFFGLGPLFVSAVAEDPLLRIRLFDFGCGALWVAFFYAAFRTDAATSRTVLAVFFGAVLFALLYFGLLVSWPPVSTLAPLGAPEQGLGARLLGAFGGAALVQELGKLALLVLIARPLKELNGAADGLFYGLIAGAAFGLCANLVQSWSLGAGDEGPLRVAGEPQAAALYATFLGTAVRALAQPFLQAVWTAIAGTFLAQGLASPGREPAPRRILLGLGLAVAFHALYETLAPPATAFFSVLVAAAALLLLLALKRESEEQPILTALR
ncbi:MAG TPA: PrsW family glutamic-type intramembrane protease [Thermoanaerobaculia bacterium]|nr:PrsW family glutamic-type intramembrane protease [Thermoanaerobaculia bacterium]